MCDRESMACCVRGEKREIVRCAIRLVKRWCVRRRKSCSASALRTGHPENATVAADAPFRCAGALLAASSAA